MLNGVLSSKVTSFGIPRSQKFQTSEWCSGYDEANIVYLKDYTPATARLYCVVSFQELHFLE
ncbi:hypothetical protein [Elizabethkingia sp. JS20170427COW]|uniref:hypothetical protein n=1 Tax=Elizabethkingia sp. JS20170427COW TaxID=2583851 RepID=UPI00111092C5|nr:hypothetical protein [Elizabethkingia sp. JS20170427COW]QCX53036.1 hypothetical protein FGE20_04470 [Elizabethkingia sp. JS20170427COW]